MKTVGMEGNETHGIWGFGIECLSSILVFLPGMDVDHGASELA
jgi:hypothetical protein